SHTFIFKYLFILYPLPYTHELSQIYVYFEFCRFSNRYNKLSRQIRDLANKLKDIDETDQWRAEMTQLFTTKLHNLGLVPTKRSLILASKVNASCFCRRRLPVLLMRSHMAETMKAAVTFVEQGHVRVGPDVITDPAFLVTSHTFIFKYLFILYPLPYTHELSQIYVYFEFCRFSNRYNKLSRQIRDLANKLKDIDETDQWRAEMTQLFTTKLHNLGLVPTKRSLILASKVNASCFCRRRLPVLLMRSHMAETMKAAVTFVEQGHVRVGPDVITDPAFLVTR
ncbi:hypothetical protein AHF37_03276, partial [Paragonimus kellicotti]